MTAARTIIAIPTDRRQSAVVTHLSFILDKLASTTPAPQKGKKKAGALGVAPTGLYLHGTVGSGNSLLCESRM